MSFWSRLASSILVVLIGTTASLILVLNQGSLLLQQVDRYPAGSTPIYLSGVSEDRSADVLSVLGRFADIDGRAIVRVDPQSTGVDGGLAALRVGVAANPHTPPAALELRFLGTTLFDSVTVTNLLTGDPAKSIGLDANAADVIAPIAELAFAPRISVVQLAHLVDVSGTINGTYRIIGADHAAVADLLRSLANASGRSPESMVSPLHGQVADGGLLPSILLGCMIAASVLLLLILIFEAVRALPVLGVHLLLGRSRWGFGTTMFRSVLVSTAATLVLSMLLVVALAHGYQLNATLLAAAWSGAVVGAAPALVATAIGAAVLTSVKPVTAILGRYSKRILLWVVAASALLATVAVSFLFAYIDGPVKEAGKLADVSRTWAAVANQQILYQLKSGNDDASITGQSSQLAEDFYHWYRSIADKPGVTLVHTAYFDREVIHGWAGVYKSPPTQPFWYMAASPSSLAAQGFVVSDNVAARAERGERVFLLPGTWTNATKRAMRGWLTEDTHEWRDPSIRTEYYDSEKIGFEDYSPRTPLFTWTTDPKLPATVTAPVILVTTPENMVPYESESLNAVGLENSYIKLSAAAAHKYTGDAYLARYHLDDNRVQFLAVGDFVAGLTKTIEATLQLFGGVIFFALVLVVLTLVALLKLFATTYREELAVKRMLGYSLPRLFVVPIVLIGTTGAIAVLASILLQSKSAIFGNVILLAIQMALITFLIRRYSGLQLSAALKE